jgi:hypothetical protein
LPFINKFFNLKNNSWATAPETSPNENQNKFGKAPEHVVKNDVINCSIKKRPPLKTSGRFKGLVDLFKTYIIT